MKLRWRLRDYLDTGWNGTPGDTTDDNGEVVDPWMCPLNTDAMELENTPTKESYLFLVNNQNDSEPAYFFGAPRGSSGEGNTLHETPKRMDDIKAARDKASTPVGESRDRGLSSIWMLSDIDDENYAFGSTLDNVKPAHNQGEARNYVFFDGHTELISRDAWPTNTSNASN